MHAPIPSRREFLRTIAMFGAYSFLGERVLSQVALGDVVAMAANDGVVHIPISSFPALGNLNGSVRIRLPGTTGVPNVIITNIGNNEFGVVDSRCTHQGTTVNTYSPNAGGINRGGLLCPQHRSLFKATGEVINGPNTGGTIQPLPRFASSFDSVNNAVRVVVPNMAYGISNVQLAQGAGPRVRLTFPTASGMRYEIRRRLTLTSPWVQAPFATTADGALTTSSINGSGAAATVFVERLSEAGFFAVVRIN